MCYTKLIVEEGKLKVDVSGGMVNLEPMTVFFEIPEAFAASAF